MTDNTIGRRGRPPRTDPEWARDIQRRIEALEDSVSVRVGPWVLNVKDGDLIATSPGTEPVVIARSTSSARVARSALESRGESGGSSGTAGR